MVFSLLAAFVLRWFGRRTAFTTGIGVICILQLLVGFLQLPSNYDQNASFSLAQVSLLFISGAVYNLSIGPLTYSILSEVPSISLRSKSVAISIAFDALYGIITNFITPYLVNPSEANARGKVDFMWGGESRLGYEGLTDVLIHGQACHFSRSHGASSAYPRPNIEPWKRLIISLSTRFQPGSSRDTSSLRRIWRTTSTTLHRCRRRGMLCGDLASHRKSAEDWTCRFFLSAQYEEYCWAGETVSKGFLYVDVVRNVFRYRSAKCATAHSVL